MKYIFLELELLDENPSWIKCNMASGTEIVCIIPRDMLEKSIQDESGIGDCLKKPGIYFLLGKIDGKKSIYVGQANTRTDNYPYQRLKEHKEDWFRKIIYLTNNNSFGSTELDYLEKTFYELIKKIRYLYCSK